MTTYDAGDELDLERVVIGPVAWAVVQTVWDRQGWKASAARRKQPGSLRYHYQHGWLEVQGLASRRLGRLASVLAAAAGHAVALRRDAVHAVVGEGAVDLEVSSEVEVCGADGSRGRPEALARRAETLDLDEVASDDTVWAVARGLCHALGLPAALTPLDADTLEGSVLVPPDDGPLDVGPSLRLEAGGEVLVVSPPARNRLDEVLELAGRLDPLAPLPDLSRWDERAARRAGLAAVPAPDSPDRERWWQAWLQVTSATRSAVGERGAIPGWKVRVDGTWELTGAEAAEVVPIPGVPPDLAAFLEKHGACRVIVAR